MKLIMKLKAMLDKSAPASCYDRENLRPVIRASICTGEQVAGFRNIHTGKFSEIMLIRTHRDLEEFRKIYGIADTEIITEY